MKPRVLLVEAAPRVTGSVRSIASAVAALRNEFEFSLVGQSSEVAKAMGVPWRRFEFAMPRRAEFLRFGPNVLTQALRFRAFTAEVRPHVVHVNDLTNLVPLVARWLGAKYRLLYHVRLLPTSYVGPIFVPFTRLILSNADRVVCVSHAVRRALPGAAHVDIVPNGLPISVIPDGLAVQTLEHRPSRPTSERIDVLYVGHFHPGKGQDLAVEALRLAVEREPRLHLSFVGSESTAPEFAAAVRNRVVRASLERHVSFLGAVAVTGPLYDQADLVLNLSESESFSMVVLEGMMHGKPVIASRSGGPDELLEVPGTGVLVLNRDVRAAAEALVQLAGQSASRQAMGARAREVAVSRFDVQHTSRQLGAIYAELSR